jgi:hypothetical protein
VMMMAKQEKYLTQDQLRKVFNKFQYNDTVDIVDLLGSIEEELADRSVDKITVEEMHQIEISVKSPSDDLDGHLRSLDKMDIGDILERNPEIQAKFLRAKQSIKEGRVYSSEDIDAMIDRGEI